MSGSAARAHCSVERMLSCSVVDPIQPYRLIRPVELALGGVREREEVRGVPPRHVGGVTGVRQLVLTELANGLEHAEPGFGSGVVALDEVVVEQDRQTIDHGSVRGLAHRLGRFEVPTAGEDRQLPVEALGCGRQRVRSSTRWWRT